MEKRPSPKLHKRDRRFWIRLNDEEHAALDKMADALGCSNKSQLIRLAIDSLSDTRPTVSFSQDRLPAASPQRHPHRQWLYEINRIGHNVNQIARYCNIHGRTAYAEDIIYVLLSVDQKLKSLLREVRQT